MKGNHTHTNRIDIEAKDLPVKTVVVFKDKAEVKKAIDVDCSIGSNVIYIKNVSPVLDRNSIRVEVVGEGIIQDVEYQEEHKIVEDFQNNTIIECEEQKEKLESEIKTIEGEIESLSNGLEILQCVANNTKSMNNLKKKNKGISLNNICRDINQVNDNKSESENEVMLPPNHLNGILDFPKGEYLKDFMTFLELYCERYSDMKMKINSKHMTLIKHKNQLVDLRDKINRLRCANEYDPFNRSIIITIKANDFANLRFYLIYQVYGTSWRPYYDIRASISETSANLDNSVQVDFFGIVEQQTEEDWIDAKIYLSTANPSISGSAPPLSRTTVSAIRATSGEGGHNNNRHYKSYTSPNSDDTGFESFDYNEISDAFCMYNRPKEITVCDGTVNRLACPGIPPLYYSIEDPVTIYKNSEKNKVKIQSFNMLAIYRHEIHPSNSTSAYLVASIINNSQNTILPGNASVYFNGNYVGMTDVGHLFENKSIKCNLGLDPSVKVEHKTPIKKLETVGIISKNNLYTHEQTLVIRNAKPSQTVNIVIRENIPKSTDERVKISLLYPDVKSNKECVRMTEDAILEWDTVLAPGEHREMVIKWSAEFPVNEKIVYKLNNKHSPNGSYYVLNCNLKPPMKW
uniref:DUF4140 domain-containing protein n=1 Tax=Parastrongyloides trichosuri TaxID=131310 RepID=A0A0N4ZAS3_PARTI